MLLELAEVFHSFKLKLKCPILTLIHPTVPHPVTNDCTSGWMTEHGLLWIQALALLSEKSRHHTQPS